MPEVVHIEATGLGEKDISLPDRWDMSIRTDPEGQNVHGPSPQGSLWLSLREQVKGYVETPGQKSYQQRSS